MGLGLILVPVLGGYLFLTRLHYTRHGILRKSGYHLFFQSAIAGGVLFAIAFLTTVLLDNILPQIGALWRLYVPFDHSGTAALSVLLGFMLPYPGNLAYGQGKAERRAVAESGALIELTILESIDRRKLVEFSLKYGKSYIGFVHERRVVAPGEFDIALIPIKSGYRDKDTHELKLTTDYTPAILECTNKKSDISDLRLEDFRIVIPMSEVRSVRIFHFEVYERFQHGAESDGARGRIDGSCDSP